MVGLLLKRTGITLGFLLTVAIVLFGLFPNAARSLIEGYPAAVWPAFGEFTERTQKAEPLARIENPSSLEGKLFELFSSSGGSALLVLKDKQIFLEHYAAGFDIQTEFNSYSMVKSLIGVLVLKAVAERRIENLDLSIGALVPAAKGKPVASVAIRELLDMRSGIIFERAVSPNPDDKAEKPQRLLAANPFGALARLHGEGAEVVLREAVVDPQARGIYRYQNANTALLGLALETVYGLPLSDLLYTKIWHPAGAGGFKWRKYPNDEKRMNTAYCCLYANIQDWARVAHYVMINGGDERFLPDELHAYLMGRDMEPVRLQNGEYRTQIRYDILNREGEGIKGRFAYFLGQGGQIIYLLPQENMVVIRFGERHQLLHSTIYEIHRMIKTRSDIDD